MPAIAIVILLLLLTAGITGIVFIVKGIRRIYRRQIRQGISYIAVGVPFLLLGCCSIFVWDPCSAEIARVKATQASINNIHLAVDRFKVDNGRYPTEKEGLEILVNPRPSWQIVGSNGIPTDPFGTPFRYTLTNGVPVVISAGPDRTFGTRDDIGR